LFFNVTVSGTSNITISSVGNFNGTVTLSLPPTLPQGLNASLINPVLKLSSKGTNMTMLVANSTSAGTFTLNITATSGLLVHTSKVTITVLDFFLHVNPGVLNVLNGTTATRVVEVNPTSFYNVTVTVGQPDMIYVDQILQSGIIAPSTGLLVSCSLNVLKITSTGNTNGQNSTNCAITGQALGDYIVIVTATSGSSGRTSNHAVSFQVAVIKPSYSIILPTTSVTTVSVGSSTSINVIISGNHNLADNVTITIVVRNVGKLAENATVVAIVGDQNISSKNVTLSPGQNVTVTITWHTAGYSPGAYMIGGKVPGVPGESILSNNLLRSPTPVTLNAANTSIFSNP